MRHFYDDNDEMPGIFNTTRGRVNDNGNINKPNDKGPYGTYQSLSEDEKTLFSTILVWHISSTIIQKRQRV